MKSIVFILCVWFSPQVYSQCESLPNECEFMRLEICEEKTLSLVDRINNSILNGVLPHNIDTLYLSALSGDDRSQFTLGVDLSNNSVSNRMKSICWLTLSRKSGVTESDHFIGKIYGDYDSSLYDINKAIAHYKMSIKSQSAYSEDSYFELGLIYESNVSSTDNGELAIKYFEKASDLGHPEASYNLGVEYQTINSATSINRAIKYYRRSIESDRQEMKKIVEPFAFNNLGVIYLTSKNHYNPALSLSFFNKAVSAGAINANYYLGYIYAEGIGVNVDNNLAKKYFNVLASEGDVKSINAIKMYRLN